MYYLLDIDRRRQGGVAFAPNLYGHPTILHLLGYGDGSNLWKFGSFYFLDTGEEFRTEKNHYTGWFGPAMAHIGDNIVMAQVDSSDHDDSSGQDILIWNYGQANLEIVGEMEDEHEFGSAITVSGRFFPECKCKFIF